MTLHIYSCETATIRSEMVQRTKPDGPFFGLRLHMNTDQTVTIWSRSKDELRNMVTQLLNTLTQEPSEKPSIPGQLA